MVKRICAAKQCNNYVNYVISTGYKMDKHKYLTHKCVNIAFLKLRKLP